MRTARTELELIERRLGEQRGSVLEEQSHVGSGEGEKHRQRLGDQRSGRCRRHQLAGRLGFQRWKRGNGVGEDGAERVERKRCVELQPAQQRRGVDGRLQSRGEQRKQLRPIAERVDRLHNLLSSVSQEYDFLRQALCQQV